jgi:hypothetical protein
MLRHSQITPESSDIILKLLVFLSVDEDRLTRFLALSGIDPQDLRDRHGDPVFQGFLLDYLFQDDQMTSAFCEECEITPEALMRVRRKLPGGGEWNGTD